MTNNWVTKLNIEYVETEDGGGQINIEWDETDPDLKYWTGLGEDGQKNFIITALETALASYKHE